MTTEHIHIVPLRVYFLIFLALVVGTVVTVGQSRVDLSTLGWAISVGGVRIEIAQNLNIIVAMTIAALKALLVVLFFMHLRYTHRLNWVFAAASVFWLALLLSLTMADMIARSFE